MSFWESERGARVFLRPIAQDAYIHYCQILLIIKPALKQITMSDNNAGDSVKQAGQKAAETIEVGFSAAKTV